MTGHSPTLQGWEFVAVLSPLETEEHETLNLIRTLPGHTCPEHYRGLIGHCDHCNMRRKRNETFVVRSTENAEYKCVGRQCLKDFLGYNADPHVLAGIAETMAQLGSLCSDAESDEWLGSGGGRDYRAWDLKRFLTLSACRIRLFGWLGRGKAREQSEYGRYVSATADHVLSLLNPPVYKEERDQWEKFKALHIEEPCDEQLAEAAIEWAKELPVEQLAAEDNNYLSNVNLISRVGTVTHKTAGIACSIIIAYQKAMEREFKRQEEAKRPVSKHIGTVGERLKCVEVECERVIMRESEYGVTGIHKMRDKEGNVITWFASGGTVIREGEKVTVDMTVKAHNEYQGRLETVVSRVTVWTEEGIAQHKEKEAKKAAREAKKAAKIAAKV